MLSAWFLGCTTSPTHPAPDDRIPLAEDDDAPHCVAPTDPDAPILPGTTPTSEPFEGSDVLSVVPDDPVGLVWYFHGSDLGASEAERIEQTATLDRLTREGIAWVAPSRTDVAAGGSWDLDHDDAVDDNPDLARLVRLREHLLATTALTADLPEATMGFSDGAGYALMVSRTIGPIEGWPILAVVPHNCRYEVTPVVPIFAIVGENDDVADAAFIAQEVADHVALGFASEIRTLDEVAVGPHSFERDPRIDPDESRAAFEDLVDRGLIDQDGQRLVPDDQLDQALKDWRKATPVRKAAYVSSVLETLWAMHHFSSAFASDECEWLRGWFAQEG